MKALLIVFALAFAHLTAVAAEPAADPVPVPGEGLPGEWAGALDVGVAKLRLALHVSADAAGALTGSLESLDQGSGKIELSAVTLDEKAVLIKAGRLASTFAGTMNDDGSEIAGTWTQGGRDLPLTFHRSKEAFTLHRPQEPKPPFPYLSKDVTFRNERAKLTLAGTFVTPEGKGPFPTVLFISGSGAQDRDEALMGHRPFLVLADFLARRGVASLRFDDRGAAKSEGDHMGSTIADFATDAEAGLALLRKQDVVDHKAIGIIGHSEGGLTGPRIATANQDIAFLVLLAPPGVPLTELIERQARDSLTLQGLDPDLIDRAFAEASDDIKLMQDESLTTDELLEKLRTRSAEQLKKFTKEELKLLGYNETEIERRLSVAVSPWYRSLIREDPAVHLRKLKIPIFALMGEKDVQVAPAENAAAIKEALATAGNPDHTVLTLPGLNHLFQHATTGAIEEYGTIEETFAPEALELIGEWISKRFGPAQEE